MKTTHFKVGMYLVREDGTAGYVKDFDFENEELLMVEEKEDIEFYPEVEHDFTIHFANASV